MMNAQQWFNAGQIININGHRLFYCDSGDDLQKDTLVILHGYPTSSYDYYKVLPLLAQHFRVVVHDHLGFGYSDKPKHYSYTLIEQADMALLLWQHLGIQSAHVLGHDYGTSVTTEIMARASLFNDIGLTLQSITLCNGSMHIEMAKLRWIQKLLMNRLTGPLVAKMSSKHTLKRTIKKIFHDPNKFTDAELDAIWEMMTHNKGREVLPQLTQYIRQRYLYWHRWIGALIRCKLPIQIVWAEKDPIAVIAMAHLIHQETINSQLITLPNLGHFPMMEDPEKWSAAVIESIQNSNFKTRSLDGDGGSSSNDA